MKVQQFNRTGNWYTIEVDDKFYNVLVVKETDSIYCEPESVLVLDEMCNRINDSELSDKIEEIMKKVDWKYDMIDED